MKTFFYNRELRFKRIVVDAKYFNNFFTIYQVSIKIENVFFKLKN